MIGGHSGGHRRKLLKTHQDKNSKKVPQNHYF
jgi:hypothetical protein